MQKHLLFLIISLVTISFYGQQQVIKDTSVVTHHDAIINGKKVSYSAKTGMQPVWDKNGKAIASLHYTYYKRKGVSDSAKRPLLISFNGGPGSGSVWMHLAYTGPKILTIDDEGYPVQPYGVKNNPFSVLDVTDIIYVNPVNTGYSRTIPLSGKEVKRDQFFGINADINYLAQWISSFVSREGRWLSPKYLIGESYGGVRVSGLAYVLQSQQWMYLNGVVLVSPADYKIYGNDRFFSQTLNLPYFAAAAWYHKKMPSRLQSKDLLEVLPEVEQFTINELLPKVAKGGALSDKEKVTLAEKMAQYSGLKKQDILDHNLRVPTNFFWKALLRDDSGHTIGRLDSRYLGLDKQAAGTKPDYNAELTDWLHSFTPAINHYFKTDLNFKTDFRYNMFGNVHPWDKKNDHTRDDLRKAMAQNPFLNVMYQTGYYDGATTYFHSKFSMWQMDPSGKLKDRFTFKGYRSGHMMYLRKEDLKSATEDLRQFILKSYNPNSPAKYQK